jgi:hypothetical protein
MIFGARYTRFQKNFLAKRMPVRCKTNVITRFRSHAAALAAHHSRELRAIIGMNGRKMDGRR